MRHANPGKKPRWPAETLLTIWWSNGQKATRTYQIKQLVWELRGFDHDIAFFERVKETKDV